MSSFKDTPDYQGNRETILQACLIAFSTLFYGLRVYARAVMTKTFGWDDWLVTVAWAFVVVQSSLDLRAVTFGSGAHIGSIPEDMLFKFFESLVIQTLIYFWVVALVRISVLVFVTRLSQEKMTKYIAWGVSAITLAQTIVAFTYRLTECSPVADNFKPPIVPGLNCVGLEADQRMMIVHGAVGLVIDLVLLVLPIYVIYSKMIFSKKAVQVMLILSVGVFVIVTGIVRLVIIVTFNFADDPTFKMATIGIWTNLEGHVGLWCSCFPALQPIIRVLSYSLGLRSALVSQPSKSGYGKSGGQSGNHSSNFSRNTKNGYQRKGSGVDTDGDSERAIVINANKDGVELYNMEAGRIHKTTEVKVLSERFESKETGRNKSWVDM